MSGETQCRVYELHAVRTAEAPTVGMLESDLCPVRFRAYLARQGEQHHLLVQGETDLPAGSILAVACLFAPLARPAEHYILRGVPMPVRDGNFAGLLLNFPGQPHPGLYTVRVKFSPDKQPAALRPIVEEAEEWAVAAEIRVDGPGSGGSAEEKRLAWRIECLSAELARIEDQLEQSEKLLDEAETDEQRESWRLEVLLLHDLAVIYGRRLAERERELETIRKRCGA